MKNRQSTGPAGKRHMPGPAPFYGISALIQHDLLPMWAMVDHNQVEQLLFAPHHGRADSGPRHDQPPGSQIDDAGGVIPGLAGPITGQDFREFRLRPDLQIVTERLADQRFAVGPEPSFRRLVDPHNFVGRPHQEAGCRTGFDDRRNRNALGHQGPVVEVLLEVGDLIQRPLQTEGPQGGRQARVFGKTARDLPDQLVEPDAQAFSNGIKRLPDGFFQFDRVSAAPMLHNPMANHALTRSNESSMKVHTQVYTYFRSVDQRFRSNRGIGPLVRAIHERRSEYPAMSPEGFAPDPGNKAVPEPCFERGYAVDLPRWKDHHRPTVTRHALRGTTRHHLQITADVAAGIGELNDDGQFPPA